METYSEQQISDMANDIMGNSNMGPYWNMQGIHQCNSPFMSVPEMDRSDLEIEITVSGRQAIISTEFTDIPNAINFLKGYL